MTTTARISKKTSAHRLTPEELAILEKQLLQDLTKAARSRVGITESADLNSYDSKGDTVDFSSSIAAKENASILVDRTNARVREIEAALQLLREQPELYGLCEICTEPIFFARLEVLPTTRRCAIHAG